MRGKRPKSRTAQLYRVYYMTGEKSPVLFREVLVDEPLKKGIFDYLDEYGVYAYVCYYRAMELHSGGMPPTHGWEYYQGRQRDLINNQIEKTGVHEVEGNEKTDIDAFDHYREQMIGSD